MTALLSSAFALFLPYVIVPAILYGAIRRMDARLSTAVLVPLSCGLGPLFYCWVLEVFWFVAPGSDASTLLLPLGIVSLAMLVLLLRPLLLEFGPVGIARRAAWPLAIMIALIAVFWTASGVLIIKNWDPQATRLLADRILAEGNVDLRALVTTPTTNDLIFVHALHGLRHILLLVTNRIAFPDPAIGWDALPTVWFMVACIMLAGAMADPDKGWFGWRYWITALLIVSVGDFILYPLNGTSGGSIAGFSCLAVVATSLRAARAPDDHFVRHWLVAGAVLGIVSGIHQTALVLAVFPLLIGIAGGALRDRRIFLGAAAGAVACLVFMWPFAYQMFVVIGGAGNANPMSQALIPYRETYRQAFEPAEPLLAVSQFIHFDQGAVVWWAGLVGGIALVVATVRGGHWRSAPAMLVLALVVATAIATIVVSDMLMTGLPNHTELILRSSRYRLLVMPLFALLAVQGLTLLWARREPGEVLALSAGRVVRESRVTRGVNFAIGLVALMALSLTMARPYLPNPTLASIGNRLADMFERTEREVFARHYPGVLAVLEENGPGGRMLLDWITAVPHVSAPISNPWMPPGVFDLFDAGSPAEAYAALKRLDIDRVLVLPGSLMGVFESSTGYRFALSPAVSSLTYDGRTVQLFERREALLPDSELTAAPVPDLTAHLENPSSCDEPFTLFGGDPLAPGDYVVSLEFESKGGTVRVSEFRDGRYYRAFLLRSWHPVAPGPQSFRFAATGDEVIELRIQPQGGLCWPDISAITAQVVGGG